MWQPFAPQLPGHEGLFDSYRAAKSIDVVAANTGNVASALTHDGVRVVSATYRGPYQSHGPMAPNCAIADVTRDSNISHPRWLGVLKAAADAAKWTPRVAAAKASNARIAVGRGMGLGTHHLQPNQGNGSRLRPPLSISK